MLKGRSPKVRYKRCQKLGSLLRHEHPYHVQRSFFNHYDRWIATNTFRLSDQQSQWLCFVVTTVFVLSLCGELRLNAMDESLGPPYRDSELTYLCTVAPVLLLLHLSASSSNVRPSQIALPFNYLTALTSYLSWYERHRSALRSRAYRILRRHDCLSASPTCSGDREEQQQVSVPRFLPNRDKPVCQHLFQVPCVSSKCCVSMQIHSLQHGHMDSTGRSYHVQHDNLV